MGRFFRNFGSIIVLLNLAGSLHKCFGEPVPPGGWSGHDHGHGHGWMKLHSNQHHDHSSKLSEAYVKFHGLGDGSTKGQGGGKGGFLSRLFGGGGDDQDQGWSAPAPSMSQSSGGGGGGGWGNSGQEIMSVQLGGAGGGGGGGWGSGGGMEMAGSSMAGWGSGGGGGGAKPTGWASGGSGGGQQMQQQQMQPAKGWQSGDFGKFRPGNSGSNDKGHFNFELPSGKPAYIQKLKPLLDLPKLKGWGWGK